MTVVHKFRRISTDLNLNAGAGAGWRTVAWNPKAATPAYGEVPEPVEETLTLLADCSSQDDLATHLQALDAMRRYADAYLRNREIRPVWWHAKAYLETGERRALVRKIETEITCPLATRADWVESYRAVVRAKVTRGGLWERTATVAMPAATPAAAAAVVYDYTASPGVDVVGDAPARISWLSISSGKTYNDPIGRLWIGILSANDYSTTLANFVHIWECEDAGATLGTNATRVAGDGTASSGGLVRVTPGTATWAKRLTINLGAVVGSVDHVVDNYGVYQWLLRTKVSAGTWEIQFRFGYVSMDDGDFLQGPIVECTGTSWDYLEQGIAEIPLRDLRCIPSSGTHELGDTYWAIQVWARRTDGSGTLDLDCFCPIPIDDGFLKATFGSMQGDASHRKDWIFAQSPGGQCQFLVFNVDTASTEFIGEPDSIHNFRLPPGDGRLVIVYARETSSDITDRLDAINTGNGGLYYPAWYSLRGSE